MTHKLYGRIYRNLYFKIRKNFHNSKFICSRGMEHQEFCVLCSCKKGRGLSCDVKMHIVLLFLVISGHCAPLQETSHTQIKQCHLVAAKIIKCSQYLNSYSSILAYVFNTRQRHGIIRSYVRRPPYWISISTYKHFFKLLPPTSFVVFVKIN